MALLTVLSFQLAPRRSSALGAAEVAAASLLPYLASTRWLAHVYLGSVGAVVNVEVLPFRANAALLLGAAALCFRDVRFDYTILVYLAKTFGGDFVAGKLDTTEWRLVLAFVFCVFAPLLAWLETDVPAAAAPYRRILPALALVQTVCELGDAKLEAYRFWRHRYSFEALTAALLFYPRLALSAAELRCVQHDLVVCLFYRFANAALCLSASGALWTASRKACFAAFGALTGCRLQNVTDAETALAVLRASDVKGDALERRIATPAWAPLLSLESVDGPQYERMIALFHQLQAALPPPAVLSAAARARVDAAAAGGAPLDAEAVAMLTLDVFTEYLFGSRWPAADLALLSAASWEWRREIAVRGRADSAVKAAAVALVCARVRASPRLFAVFGERWDEPEYFSLILQPYLISPAINVGDIAVAMKLHPTLSVEEAMREMHPFPILERFVAHDLAPAAPGARAVRAGTQVIMFTSDFRCRGGGAALPPFGAGGRACAGTALALALLRPMHASLRLLPSFLPEQGHRFSGRNNDGTASWSESAYFVRTIGRTLLEGAFRRPPSQGIYGAAAVGEAPADAGAGDTRTRRRVR